MTLALALVLAKTRGVPLVAVLGLATAYAAPAAPRGAAFEEPAAADADQPLQAGTDVPAPKRRHLVLPEYPEAAKALGVRGIVLIELTIERDGSVGDARIVRSIPELDEAALSAVRQWQYEITRVDGQPVRVRLAVPITFSMKLPELEREEGVPELRQGVAPSFPIEGGSGTTVEAEVTLDANGRVAEALVTKGESPWAEALLRSLRTWIFAWDDPTALVAFRVQAEFVRAKKIEESRVTLRALGARRLTALDLVASASPGAPAAGAAAAEPAAPSAAQPPADRAVPEAPPGAPPAAATAGVPAPAQPVPAAPPEAAPAATAPPAAPPPPTATSSGASGADAQAARPAQVPAPEAAKPRPASPPVEVIRVPPPRPAEPADGAPGAPADAAPKPAEPGYSSVRDVALGIGVPDLSQGRRPIVPPLARMAGVTGRVEVAFSVGASGLPTIQTTTGPDAFKLAAQEMVQSWVFRRTSTERIYLLAVIDYGTDTAKANVSVVP
jgi:TonB family protein